MHLAPPNWPAALWIVRHGESAGNLARDAAEAQQLERIEIAAPRDMDVPLSPLGEEQAQALGRWVAALPPAEQPTAVLASPYVRARRTAELLLEAAGLPHLPFFIDERLREREFGVLDRLTRFGIERLFPEQAQLRRNLGKFYHRPPGGESWSDVILRLRSVVEMLSRERRGQRVLVLCHSAVVLCMRYVLEHMTEEQILAIDRASDVANCSLTAYELAGDSLELRRFNFVAPLLQQGTQVTRQPDAAAAPK